MREVFRKPIMVAVKNYAKLKGQSTPITELYQNLSDGESRYPVLLGGYVHCGDNEGKPLTSLTGPDCCFQRIWNRDIENLKVLSDKYLDIYIKDDIDPNERIFVPKEYINVEDIFSNINMFIEIVDDKVEMILPYNAPIFAIGKVQKKGKRLYLSPEESVPHSLYFMYDQNPLYHFPIISNALNINHIFSFLSFTLGMFFLGYGSLSFYRKRWRH
jgi:hypothetical protein